MERTASTPSEKAEPKARSADITQQLQNWCDDLLRRLPDMVEIAILRLGRENTERIAASPKTMVLERIGYREAVSRMRATGVAAVVPLDRPEDGIAETIALPIDGLGIDIPIVLLVGVTEMPASRLKLLIAQLETALGWVMYTLKLEEMMQTERKMAIYDQAFLLCAETLDTETPLEARQTMASICAESLGCDRVVLVRQGILGLKIQAISGESRFDRQSRINDLTRQVAHEAKLRRAPVRWDRGAQENTSIIGQLAKMHGDAVAMAVPLTDSKGQIDEVIVLHWGSLDKVPELTSWSVLWSLSRPILAQKDLAARGSFTRIYYSIKLWLKRLFGPRAFKFKLIASLTLITLYTLIFVRVDDTLRADVVIDDPDLRVISAPMDGFIDKIFVIPGDAVTVGQALVQLEDDEVKLRIAELDAQIARHTARASVARANRDRAEAVVADAERAEAEARLGLAQRELEQTLIVARMAGLVIEGDLRQRLGARVTFGEELLRIAPRQGIELKLSVRNRDGDHLAEDLVGYIRLDAAPDEALSVRVTRIKPGAETIDGELRFVAFGELQSVSSNIENGMQGTARISLGQAPIYEVWLKPIAETIYMFLWRWIP